MRMISLVVIRVNTITIVQMYYKGRKSRIYAPNGFSLFGNFHHRNGFFRLEENFFL